MFIKPQQKTCYADSLKIRKAYSLTQWWAKNGTLFACLRRAGYFWLLPRISIVEESALFLLGRDKSVPCELDRNFYFARSRGGEVLQWARLCVSMCVCLSISPWAYLPNHTRDLYQIFVRVDYRRGLVLLRRGDAIPMGKCNFWGFLHYWKCIAWAV